MSGARDQTGATTGGDMGVRPSAGVPCEGVQPPEADAIPALADALHSAAIHLLRRLRSVDAESGLTGPRLSALSVIVYGGPLTPGALAAAEQVRPPTMTRLVAALESEGLVSREADPSDGRQVLLRATEAGRSLLDQGRARRIASLARRLERLSAAERAELRSAAATIARLAREPEQTKPMPH